MLADWESGTGSLYGGANSTVTEMEMGRGGGCGDSHGDRRAVTGLTSRYVHQHASHRVLLLRPTVRMCTAGNHSIPHIANARTK